MPNIRKPRAGSLQYWPRKRAKRVYARLRNNANIKDVVLSGFAGYKVGMTHILYTENKKGSPLKGETVFMPVTIIECPPMRIASIKFIKKTPYGIKTITQIWSPKLEKELSRKTKVPKKKGKDIDSVKDFEDVKVVVYTMPKKTTIGKKKPELFELALGGTKEDKIKFIKENWEKDIDVKSVLNEGELIDAHAVTKGRGFQGAIKRFGITIRRHKSEKVKRGSGSLGPWKGQQHIMYRIPNAGKDGYHQRTDYNKHIVKIGIDSEEINQKGGFLSYGNIKNPYILLKGTVPGAKKRPIIMTKAIRPKKQIEVPAIEYISKESKQR